MYYIINSIPTKQSGHNLIDTARARSSASKYHTVIAYLHMNSHRIVNKQYQLTDLYFTKWDVSLTLWRKLAGPHVGSVCLTKTAEVCQTWALCLQTERFPLERSAKGHHGPIEWADENYGIFQGLDSETETVLDNNNLLVFRWASTNNLSSFQPWYVVSSFSVQLCYKISFSTLNINKLALSTFTH